MKRTEDNYDKFSDYEYSSKEWSAKTLIKPEEIQHALSLLHLEGRKIKWMKFIGLCYNLRRDCLEDCVYNYYDQRGGMDEEEMQRKSDYENIDPQFQFSRWVEIDEPLLIEFEDGDCFEIKTPFAGEYRFSMNKIPWGIHAGINLPNAEAGTLLAPARGKTIVAVELDKGTKESHPAYFEDMLVGDLDEYVAGIILRLEDGSGLRIYGNIDFTWVESINSNNEPEVISFSELKAGLFNWEDLHYDESVDFLSYSHIFFFGKRGADYVSRPFVTLVPGVGKTELYVYSCDFDPFDWAISSVTGRFFDEFGDYDFTAQEWASILDEAETLISFESFDELFAYIRSLKTPDGESDSYLFLCINTRGADFWKKRDTFRKRLSDLRKWTELTMSGADHMQIRGY